MPSPERTDVTIILDRSGSMASVARETLTGFNRFLADQRGRPGAGTMTLVQFDDRYEILYCEQPFDTAPELTSETFVPRGSTALLDAIGHTIAATADRLAGRAEEDQPDTIVLVILTDGLENASQHYTMQRVSEMIGHQKEAFGWRFIFLGANQDAIESAGDLGIAADSALTYADSGTGIEAAFVSISRGLERLRGRSAPTERTPFFEPLDRERQEEELRRGRTDSEAADRTDLSGSLSDPATPDSVPT